MSAKSVTEENESTEVIENDLQDNLPKQEAKSDDLDLTKLAGLRAKNQAKNIYNNMVNVFNRGSKLFWNNPISTPQQISDALGTDAKELFELHYKLGQLISTINPADIMEGSSVVGNFVYEEDGRVTIVNNNP
jgi:hypothetical protein